MTEDDMLVVRDALRERRIPIPEQHERALFYRELPDDLEIVVLPMLGYKARLCIGQRESLGYLDGYCYADPMLAILAAIRWNGQGDPLNGWHRHIGSGRRREDGDPSKETRAW